MTVETIMTREVASCGPTESLNRAAQLMWERDCGSVPILDGGRVIGMITDRDICMAAYTRGRPIEHIRLDEVMSREPRCCSPRESIATVEERMGEYQIRRMPVIEEDGTLLGIVSLNDIALAAERSDGRAGCPTKDELAGTLMRISHHRGMPQSLEAE